MEDVTETPVARAIPIRTGAQALQGGRSTKVNVMANRLVEIEKRLSLVIVEKEDLKKKIEFQHKQIIHILGFLGDVETRLEALRSLGIEKDLFISEDYERTWDKIKGLRIRSDEEIVEKGDFVTIKYTAEVDGKVVNSEEHFPLRVGAGTMVIEDEIIGKPVGTKNLKFSKPYHPDKTVHYTMDFVRVKTRITENE